MKLTPQWLEEVTNAKQAKTRSRLFLGQILGKLRAANEDSQSYDPVFAAKVEANHFDIKYKTLDTHHGWLTAELDNSIYTFQNVDSIAELTMMFNDVSEVAQMVLGDIGLAVMFPTVDYPETHQQGSVQFYPENLPNDLRDVDLGVQIANDGRVWVCVNGAALLRFKPGRK